MAPTKSSRRNKLERIRREGFKIAGEPYLQWSVKEKRAILQGLKEYGGSDLNRLLGFVPTKSAEDIHRFIEARKRRCVVGSPLTRAPIELWLDKAQRNVAHQFDYSSGLAQVVSSCVQTEFTDLYQFLIHLLKGESPPELSDVAGSVLRALLHDLAKLMRSLDMEEVLKCIKDFQNSESSSGMPANNDELDHADCSILKFYNEGSTGTMKKEDLNSFNPIKLPPSLLRKVFLSVSKNL